MRETALGLPTSTQASVVEKNDKDNPLLETNILWSDVSVVQAYQSWSDVSDPNKIARVMKATKMETIPTLEKGAAIRQHLCVGDMRKSLTLMHSGLAPS